MQKKTKIWKRKIKTKQEMPSATVDSNRKYQNICAHSTPHIPYSSYMLILKQNNNNRLVDYSYLQRYTFIYVHMFVGWREKLWHTFNLRNKFLHSTVLFILMHWKYVVVLTWFLHSFQIFFSYSIVTNPSYIHRHTDMV